MGKPWYGKWWAGLGSSPEKFIVENIFLTGNKTRNRFGDFETGVGRCS